MAAGGAPLRSGRGAPPLPRARLLALAWVVSLCCSQDLPDFGDDQQEDEPESYCTPEYMSRFPGGWPLELDASLYWFGRGDVPSKAVSSEKSDFYDPTKPTMIYFHGWTGADGGWTTICKRATTRCPKFLCKTPDGGGEDTLLMDRWIDAGWNVGFFYWDQFADEECTRDAEQKIWFDRGGDGFMWKSYDVAQGIPRYNEVEADSVTVTDWCVRAVKAAMGDYKGPEVRFVGHSIGAQLATRCAAMLHKEEHEASPQRLALLEPYFSKHHFALFRCNKVSTDEGIGDFTAAETASYIKSLYEHHQVVTEVYKSSVLTEMSEFGVTNEDLEKLTTIVEYKPEWCGGLGMLSNSDLGHLKCRHLAVFPLYFLSFNEPPPPVDPPPDPEDQTAPSSAIGGCETPSPACTYGQIREWIERQLYVKGSQKWVQYRGSPSFDTGDDIFVLSPSLAEEKAVDGGAANRFVQEPGALEPPKVHQDTLMAKGEDFLAGAKSNSRYVAMAVLAAAVMVVGTALALRCKAATEEADSEDDSAEDGESPAMRRRILDDSRESSRDSSFIGLQDASPRMKAASLALQGVPEPGSPYSPQRSHLSREVSHGSGRSGL